MTGLSGMSSIVVVRNDPGFSTAISLSFR